MAIELDPIASMRDLPTVNTIPIVGRWSGIGTKDVYLDYELFAEEKLKSCQSFDALVYTASASRLKNCKRLVCAKLNGLAEGATKIRYAANLHTKLYIMRFGRLSLEVWVGSGNLVSSTGWLNIMVRVHGADARMLRNYFEDVWKLSGH